MNKPEKSPRHSQSCSQCKQVLSRLLKVLAGDVREQHDLRLPARLEDYRNSPFYETLQKIYHALQQHRGFKDFVKRRSLGKVDYFLPNRHLGIEFDESQHFTAPRRLTLELYPSELTLSFDRQRWEGLCKQLDRHDNSPKYRDEQRAWLDVLRDFSSLLLGNQPTVRIYARDEEWCSFDPDHIEDVKKFAEYLPIS
jgi:hypothetical protein